MKRSRETADGQVHPENGWTLISQGAEGKVWELSFSGKPAIAKERFSKSYRHRVLDKRLTQKRVLGEARSLMKCRRVGLDTPALLLVDLSGNRLFMERIEGTTIKQRLHQLLSQGLTHADSSSSSSSAATNPYGIEGVALARAVGSAVARMHNAEVIHGDLTTSNMMLRTTTAEHYRKIQETECSQAFTSGGGGGSGRIGTNRNDDGMSVAMIDFGLSSVSSQHEDKAVDLYVLERALASTHAHSQQLVDEVMRVYKAEATRSDSIMQKLAAVRARGRKRECFG